MCASSNIDSQNTTDAIWKYSKSSRLVAGYHSDSTLPQPKSTIAWFGGIFASLKKKIPNWLLDYLMCKSQTLSEQVKFLRAGARLAMSRSQLPMCSSTYLQIPLYNTIVAASHKSHIIKKVDKIK